MQSEDEIDLDEMNPIDRRKTAVSVNCVLMNMVDFLNTFANQMDFIVTEAERLLRMTDAKLTNMELMLSSVQLPEPTVDERGDCGDVDIEEDGKKTDEENGGEDDNQEEEKKILNDTNKKTDPRCEKYLKMLRYGIPEAAVKQKMVAENVDPNLLDQNFNASSSSLDSFSSD